MFQYVKLTKIIETTKFISLKIRVKRPMEVLKKSVLEEQLVLQHPSYPDAFMRSPFVFAE